MVFDEKNEVVESNSEVQHQSKLTFDEQVISKIVMMSLREIDGVAAVKSGAGSLFGRGGNVGINVEVGETEVAVDLRLILQFGKNAKEIYEKLKSSIEEQVYNMTGLKVVEVNVKIEDVLTEEEFKAKTEA